jgi:hypothetical protein
VSSDEVFCCQLQNFQIKRLRDMPGTPILKGRQNRRGPDSVAIDLRFCLNT